MKVLFLTVWLTFFSLQAMAGDGRDRSWVASKSILSSLDGKAVRVTADWYESSRDISIYLPDVPRKVFEQIKASGRETVEQKFHMTPAPDSEKRPQFIVSLDPVWVPKIEEAGQKRPNAYYIGMAAQIRVKTVTPEGLVGYIQLALGAGYDHSEEFSFEHSRGDVAMAIQRATLLALADLEAQVKEAKATCSGYAKC